MIKKCNKCNRIIKNDEICKCKQREMAKVDMDELNAGFAYDNESVFI